MIHCHAGQSRTGLALRAWFMHRDGCDEATATERACAVWPHTTTRNETFTKALRAWGGSR